MLQQARRLQRQVAWSTPTALANGVPAEAPPLGSSVENPDDHATNHTRGRGVGTIPLWFELPCRSGRSKRPLGKRTLVDCRWHRIAGARSSLSPRRQLHVLCNVLEQLCCRLCGARLVVLTIEIWTKHLASAFSAICVPATAEAEDDGDKLRSQHTAH